MNTNIYFTWFPCREIVAKWEVGSAYMFYPRNYSKDFDEVWYPMLAISIVGQI